MGITSPGELIVRSGSSLGAESASGSSQRSCPAESKLSPSPTGSQNSLPVREVTESPASPTSGPEGSPDEQVIALSRSNDDSSEHDLSSSDMVIDEEMEVVHSCEEIDDSQRPTLDNSVC